MVHPFLDVRPQYNDSNFIAPSADVIGDVRLGPEASVWFNATVRGDVNWIEIGEGSNVQDGAVVHVTGGTAPTRIGPRVTVGHGAIVHGCTVEADVLVGMGAVILDHAVIGEGSIVGARALVTGRVRIPPRSLVLGTPAEVVRTLSDEEVEGIGRYAARYRQLGAIYRGAETPEENPFYRR